MIVILVAIVVVVVLAFAFLCWACWMDEQIENEIRKEQPWRPYD